MEKEMEKEKNINQIPVKDLVMNQAIIHTHQEIIQTI